MIRQWIEKRTRIRRVADYRRVEGQLADLRRQRSEVDYTQEPAYAAVLDYGIDNAEARLYRLHRQLTPEV